MASLCIVTLVKLRTFRKATFKKLTDIKSQLFKLERKLSKEKAPITTPSLVTPQSEIEKNTNLSSILANTQLIRDQILSATTSLETLKGTGSHSISKDDLQTRRIKMISRATCSTRILVDVGFFESEKNDELKSHFEKIVDIHCHTTPQTDVSSTAPLTYQELLPLLKKPGFFRIDTTALPPSEALKLMRFIKSNHPWAHVFSFEKLALLNHNESITYQLKISDFSKTEWPGTLTNGANDSQEFYPRGPIG